ncbi:hypothetical protein L3X38_003749 [Prunus dulcis]|uniref:Uncharacterized protein n=1 Tax=Prunus dulcis TaxID=3755 RepID=A0AAD4ZMM4_PRUDU|nr:hypothetical protein L3X38_003749 [Prunus dulcis]
MKSEHKVESGLFLDVVVGDGAAILELIASKDRPLLVWQNTFLVLDLDFDIVDYVGAFQGVDWSSISRDDIIKFLDLHHVQKLDIPFSFMHRKDECQSLLKDPEHLELEEENQDKLEKPLEIKWHKVYLSWDCQMF